MQSVSNSISPKQCMKGPKVQHPGLSRKDKCIGFIQTSSSVFPQVPQCLEFPPVLAPRGHRGFSMQDYFGSEGASSF